MKARKFTPKPYRWRIASGSSSEFKVLLIRTFLSFKLVHYFLPKALVEEIRNLVFTIRYKNPDSQSFENSFFVPKLLE